MTAKKRRQSLNDALEKDFVFGSQGTPLQIDNPPVAEPHLEPLPVDQPQTVRSKIMEKLITAPEKERIIRFTVDLPESMHRKLSILCAQTGRKKADVVRMLLSETLEGIED